MADGFLLPVLKLRQPYRLPLVQVRSLVVNLLCPLTHRSSGFAVVMAEAPETASSQQDDALPSA